MVTGNGRHPRPSRARAVCLQVSSHSDSQSQSPPIFRLNRSTLTARRQFRSHPSSHRLIQEISFLSTQFFVLQTDKYLWGSHTGSCMIQCQFEEVCCKFVLLKKKVWCAFVSFKNLVNRSYCILFDLLFSLLKVKFEFRLATHCRRRSICPMPSCFVIGFSFRSLSLLPDPDCSKYLRLKHL